MNFIEILTLFRKGKGEIKSHLKNLIEVAMADGKLGEEERDLLLHIASRNRIALDVIQSIQQNNTDVVFINPDDPIEKFRQLYELVLMMSIDKTIHPDELKLCDIYAIKFGYPKDQVPGLTQMIRLNISNGIGYEEAMKRIAVGSLTPLLPNLTTR